MPLEDLLLGFVAGAAGSFLMWLFIAPKMIVRYGQRALERWIDRAIPEDPEEAAAKHRPMDPYMKRLMVYASWHFSQTLSGVLGKLDQEVSEKLKNVDLSKVAPQLINQAGGLGGILDMLGGANGGAKGKGGGWTDALAMLSAFGQMQGQASAAPLAGLPAGHPLRR